MTLEVFKDWLKTQVDVGDGIQVGGINGNKACFLGVYAGKGGPRQRICLGGKDQTRYQPMVVSILVHWTKSMVQADEKAREIHSLLFGLTDVKMGEERVISADPGEGPIPLGKDDKGICEYLVNATILYETKGLMT